MVYNKNNEYESLVIYISLSLIIAFLFYGCCECCIGLRKSKNRFNVVNLYPEYLESIENNSVSNNNRLIII